MRDVLDRLTDEVSDSVNRFKDAVFGPAVDDDLPEIFRDDGRRDRDFQADAAIISTAIMDQFAPDSVFDIGCGIGLHMKPFLDADIDAAGVDETDVAHENAVVPTKRIAIQNLTAPYDPGERYDMVLCIDMLEYTAPEQEAALLTTITNAVRETAVVSVPLPRYSSFRYDREEPLAYWVDRFDDHGLQYDEAATQELQERVDADEEAWVPEQLLVFRATAQATA
jgi:SAM-dependent methyltransferase